jgi:hypothetical protein
MVMSLLIPQDAYGLANATSTFDVKIATTPGEKAQHWGERSLSAYDSATNKLYVGASASGATDYAISELTWNSGTSKIDRKGLTASATYSDPDNTSSELVTNYPAYNKEVWDMQLLKAGATTYIAAIMRDIGDSSAGGTRIALIDVSSPKKAFFSPVATTLDASPANTRFLKIAVGCLGSDANVPVIFAAIADPTTGHFNTSKDTTGIRAYRIPSSITTNTLAEVDIDGAGSKTGLQLGTVTAKISNKLRRLTSMHWDADLKRLYLAGHNVDNTAAVYAFYMSGSDELTALAAEPFSTTAVNELSKVHNISVMKNVGGSATKFHAIIHAGETPTSRNNIYALALVNKSGTAAEHGRFADMENLGSHSYTNDPTSTIGQTWLERNGTTGLYDHEKYIVVGRGALPIPPRSHVTSVKTVGNKVYASVANATKGSELWVSTVTINANGEFAEGANPSAWSAWQRVNSADLHDLDAFAVGGSSVWAVKERSKAAYYSSIPAAAAPTTSTLAPKDATVRMRFRRLGLYDKQDKQFYVGAVNTGQGAQAIQKKRGATGAETDLNKSNFNNKAIWDMTLLDEADGTRSLIVLPHTEIGETPSSGGKAIVKVAADGTVTEINSTDNAALFKDGNATPEASRCIKVVAGAKPDGTPVIFSFIPDAGQTSFDGGNVEDIIRLHNADLTTTLTSVKDYKATIGDLNIDRIESVHWDSTLQRLYIGAHKGGGTDIGLSFVNLTGNGADFETSGKLLAGDLGFKHILHVKTLHTSARSYLILNGTADDVSTAKVYALPIVRSHATAANVGKIAQAADLTAPTTDHGTNATWTSSSALAKIGGGDLPVNAKAIVSALRVVGDTVFATVVNPLGINGSEGVFASTAIIDTNNELVGWTTWKHYAGQVYGTQEFDIDETTGDIVSLEHDSPVVKETKWKVAQEESALHNLAKSFNTDFAAKGGVYSLSDHIITDGTKSSDIVLATGYGRVGIGHIQHKTSTENRLYDPYRSNYYGYKFFDNDTELDKLGPIFRATASTGTTGWIFAAGHGGLAALRVGSNGKGWTGSVPEDLRDATSTTVGISDMTWKVIDGITGPIYKSFTITDTSSNQWVVAAGEKELYAFQPTAGKLKDSSPDALALETLSSFSSATDEVIHDVQPLHETKGTMLVATSKGLYLAQIRGLNDFVKLSEIQNTGSASIGPVASLHITHPSSKAANHWYTIDLLTSQLVKNKSSHYRVKLNLNTTSGDKIGTPTAALVTNLENMRNDIRTEGPFTHYTAIGDHYGEPAGLHTLERSQEGSGVPARGSLDAPSRGRISSAALTSSTGAGLVAVGGAVHVRSA